MKQKMNKNKVFKGKTNKISMICKKILQLTHDLLKFYPKMPIVITGTVKKYDSLMTNTDNFTFQSDTENHLGC